MSDGFKSTFGNATYSADARTINADIHMVTAMLAALC